MNFKKIAISISVFLLIIILLIIIIFYSFFYDVPKSLQNGTYYMDSNHEVYFTVTDLKDEVDPNGQYYQTCKIQFSETYDIESLQKNYINYWASLHFYDYDDAERTVELMERIIAEYTEIYQKSVDMKKLLVDNACTFYIYDIVDEKYDSIYTPIPGADKDTYIELTLDSDGSVSVPVAGADIWILDKETFRK